MRNITSNDVLANQPKLRNAESKDWTDYYASIALTISGGLFFVLIGFFLLVTFTVSGGTNTAMNYTGICSLIIAFAFFGMSAHFMDKSDENKSQHKKLRIEKFNRK